MLPTPTIPIRTGATARSLAHAPYGRRRVRARAGVRRSASNSRTAGPACCSFSSRSARVARVALGVPLVGEATRLDVVGERAHGRREVEMVVAPAARELSVLARRRVELGLHRVADLAEQPVGALDLTRQHELGDDRLDRDAVLDHRADERVVHRRERGRQHLLDAEVEHRFLHRRELDRALPQPADRPARRRARAPAPRPVTSRCTPTAVMKPTPSS